MAIIGARPVSRRTSSRELLPGPLKSSAIASVMGERFFSSAPFTQPATSARI